MSSGPGDRDELPVARWRLRRLLPALLAPLLLVGLALLVERAAGYRGVLDRLRSAGPGWFGAAVAAEAVSFAAFAVALRGVLALRGGPSIRLRTATRLVFASIGASRAVLGGGPAGIAVFAWAAGKAGLDRRRTAAHLLALYGLLFGVLGVGTWVAAVVLTATTDAALGGLTLPWLVAVPLLFLAAAGFRAPRVVGWTPARLGSWLQTGLSEIEHGFALVRDVVAHPRRETTLLVAAAFYWLGDAGCLWGALRAFRVELTPDRLLLAYSTAYLVTVLPLPFGGVGTVEAVALLTLRSVGVPVTAGLLAVLGYRAVSFWLPTLPGLTSFATLGPLGRRLSLARVRKAKG